MGVSALAHYAIRTTDLERSRRFYVEVLGLRVGRRPPFDFPGLWLYASEDEPGCGLVHLIGASPDAPDGLERYLGRRAGEASGGGAVDHIALAATGWAELERRCRAHGLDYAERTVPELGLRQVFLTDPSGVTIELNYPATERANTVQTEP